MPDIKTKPQVLPRRLGRARCWSTESITTFREAVERDHDYRSYTPLHAWFRHIPVLVTTLRKAKRTKVTTEADWLETLDMVLALPGLDVNALDGDGKTALHRAVELAVGGTTFTFLQAAVERLIAAGADVRLEDGRGSSPLDVAIKDENDLLTRNGEHVDLIATLAAAGGIDPADLPESLKPKVPRKHASEPMDVPFAIGHTFSNGKARAYFRHRRFKDDVIEARQDGGNDDLLVLWLRAHPEPIDAMRRDGADTGDAEDVLHAILELPTTDVNRMGGDGQTPLHRAITMTPPGWITEEDRRKSVTVALLRKGANPLVCDGDGKTPYALYVEAHGDDPFDMLRALLESLMVKERARQEAALRKIADEQCSEGAPARGRKRL